MRRTLLAVTLAAAGGLGLAAIAAGCADRCEAACDFEDQDTDRVCDGDNFRTCSEGNLGDTITCGGGLEGQRAVCTGSGWTVEDIPTP